MSQVTPHPSVVRFQVLTTGARKGYRITFYPVPDDKGSLVFQPIIDGRGPSLEEVQAFADSIKADMDKQSWPESLHPEVIMADGPLYDVYDLPSDTVCKIRIFTHQ